MNYEELKKAIEGVEENNKMYDGNWSDFETADDIADAYNVSIDDNIRDILNRAIETNGASLADDIPAAELLTWGVAFSPSTAERIEKKYSSSQAARAMRAVNSPAQQQAARENGRKGGRPVQWYTPDNMSDEYGLDELAEMNRRLTSQMRDRGLSLQNPDHSDEIKHLSELIKSEYDRETL